jgi:5-methylcytosine-specific restriction endonuclease McrBC GTP-binding regulatory subunit McrB
MVLDEMNLSRIEYYFADFLSVMEYPAEDWKIRIYDPQNNQRLPKKLDGGCISVPTNTYFVGTANTDDSTFTVTDKVYDRAVVIDFDEKVKPIETSYKSDSVNISAEGLQSLFNKAINDENLRLSKKETDKFLKICDFMKDAFDVRFGNRIMVQIETFVPVYVALGGTKEEALDFMFARKILRKVDGMYEDFVKDELANLSKLITTSYGKNVFTETENMIAKFTKRLV